jgi:hypothetical protein
MTHLRRQTLPNGRHESKRPSSGQGVHAGLVSLPTHRLACTSSEDHVHGRGAVFLDVRRFVLGEELVFLGRHVFSNDLEGPRWARRSALGA